MLSRDRTGIAVELCAAPVLFGAAPVLLGIRPALQPIGEAGVAVIDSATLMSHSCGKNMSVDVVASMPGARASHVLVAAAPRLLVRRPSEVPIGIAFLAVISEVMLRMLVDDLWRQVDIVVLVDDMRWRRQWDRHIVVDDLRFFTATSALTSTAVCLVLHCPHVLPVVVASFTIQHIRLTTGRLGPEIPQQPASTSVLSIEPTDWSLNSLSLSLSLSFPLWSSLAFFCSTKVCTNWFKLCPAYLKLSRLKGARGARLLQEPRTKDGNDILCRTLPSPSRKLPVLKMKTEGNRFNRQHRISSQAVLLRYIAWKNSGTMNPCSHPHRRTALISSPHLVCAYGIGP